MLYLVISGNNLQIVTNKGQQILAFPPEAVRYQEIVNKELFEKLITDFFAKSQKHEAGIFLHPALIYHKIIPAKTNPEITTEEESFFHSVPIAPSSQINLTVKGKPEIIFISTNKHLFTPIIDTLTAKGWKIKFIVPLTVFGENLPRELNYQILKKLHKQKKLISKFDFLKTLTQENSHEKKSINKKLLLFIFILFLSFLTLGITVFLQFNKPSQNPVKITPTPTLPITPTTPISPAATISATLSKSEIKVQIFNGSGTPGEATTISNNLTTLGFTNIEIGDAEGAESNTTIVIFSQRTPQEYRDEILNELKKSFSNIETQEIATSDSYDVFITTGATAL